LHFFFLEFSPPSRVWVEFGSKIHLSLFRPISSYLIPFLLKITSESCFWIFLLFFSVILSPGSSMSGIRVKNSFISFSAYLILSLPVLARNNIRKLFFNFLNFFAIFFGIFSPGSSVSEIWVYNSFIPFSANLILSHPILTTKNAGKLFFNFFNFIAIFFGIFSPASSMSGIRV